MLMAQLWWVQADVTMKRWRDINDSLRRNTGRIKSHINHLAYQQERMFTALLQGFLEHRNTALWHNLSHLQCFMLHYTDAAGFFGVVGFQSPVVDWTSENISSWQDKRKWVRWGEFQHITWLCLFTLKPWAQGSFSVYVKVIQIQFTSAHFHSEKQNLLKLLKVIWQL